MSMEVEIRLVSHALAILVFDASNPDSMNSLDKWLAELKSNNVGRECDVVFALSLIVAVMLACNKIDLAKTLNRDAVTRYAESIGAKAVFTSAKTGDGVTALFTSLSDSIVERRCAAASYAARSYGAEKPVSPSDPAASPEKKSCCCCSVSCNKHAMLPPSPR